MDRMIAFCGLICSDCPAYLATQSDDRDALEQVLANLPDASTIEDIMCDGCLKSDGRLTAHCEKCIVRPCALSRGLQNCAYCDEYICEKLQNVLETCDGLEGFFGFARQARTTLDGIRAELQK